MILKNLLLRLFLGLVTLYLLKADAQKISHEALVAVIDTGVDLKNIKINKSLWTNPGESGLDQWGHNKSSNGKDDDQNGYVDDVHGWNFVQNNNNLNDEVGHGTHVTGIILDQHENFSSLSNKDNNKMKLMILKYYSPYDEPHKNLKNTIKAMRYARTMKAQIVNYSAGGSSSNLEEFSEILQAREKGVIFVVAAGNEKSNADRHKYYPASYRLDNIVSVAALGKNGQLSTFSNYGKSTIDLAAPGENILSALPGENEGYLSGTSQATAFVTGALSAVVSENPNHLSYHELLAKLFKKAKPNLSLKGLTKLQLAFK